MSKVKISIGQFAIQKGDPSANWQIVQQMTAEAARQGGDIIVFPELWNAGYVLPEAEQHASILGEGLFADLANLAAKHNIHIVGSTFEQCPNGVANTASFISPRAGLQASYQKIHLFPLMDEHLWLQGGNQPIQLATQWGEAALAICYDLRFPELFRRYAVNGAKITFLPSEWPHPRLAHFQMLVKARAIENQMFMVAVNRVGIDEDSQTHFCGHSMIIDPWGDTVIELGENEGVYTTEIDLDLVDAVRQKIPILQDRRPETYTI